MTSHSATILRLFIGATEKSKKKAPMQAPFQYLDLLPLLTLAGVFRP
jgi:hypothetical protein